MTTVNVQAAEAIGSPEPEGFRSEAPAAAPSPLDGLKAKLASVRGDLYTDLKVPRWDEPPPDGRGMGISVFVRYRPVSPSEARRISDRFEKIGASDWGIQANAQVLVDACMGVYALIPGDDTKYSLREGDPTGPWTRMDPALADMLGPNVVKDATTGVGVCRGLYATDGDVTIAALQLSNWSSQSSEPAEKGFPRP